MKQVNRLSESFLVKGYSEFLKRIGEPPVIIDTSATNKSLKKLESYYNSKGYFNNTGEYQIVDSKKKRKASIEYSITLNKPYIVDTIQKTLPHQSWIPYTRMQLGKVLLDKVNNLIWTNLPWSVSD